MTICVLFHLWSIVCVPDVTPETQKVGSSEQHQFVLSFRAAMTNPNFRQTLQNISKSESVKMLTETILGLSEDQIAL